MENSKREKLLTERLWGLFHFLHRVRDSMRDPTDGGHLVLCVSKILLAGETRRVTLQSLELLRLTERTVEYFLLLLLILAPP